MLDQIVANAPVFLLISVRCFTMMMSLPLLSARNIPRMAKVALALYMAIFIFPQVSLNSGIYADYSSYILPNGNFNIEYIFLLLGEGLIGLIMGFYVQIIFAAFSTAGQFFAFQMGFSASEVYDSLNQVENPLMGQFFNFIALLVFLQNEWFQTLFLKGLVTSFNSLNAFSIVMHNEDLAKFMVLHLSIMFKDALIVALPIMGTLFLINVTMGVLSKAAPQMNLLSEGFPILILTSFFVIYLILPQFVSFVNKYFIHNLSGFSGLFKALSVGG